MSDFEFRLPDVGEGLSEGEIVRWHVAPGEPVTADQILVDVETDKAVVEIPAPVSGVLKSQGGQPGEILPVGGLLAVIETDGEAAAAAPEPAAEKAPPATGPTPEAPAQAAAPAPEEAAGGRRRVLASPATRKLAVELGVDLAAVTGSGERGRVTRDDVLRAAEGTEAAPAQAAERPPEAAVARREEAAPVGEDRVEPLRGLRRRIAQTMAVAWREIPHITSFREIEAEGLVRAQRALQEEFAESGVKLTYLPFFVKAAVVALKRHPRFNASLDMEREEIIYRHRYNIGLATATPDGLMVTVLHDADTMSLPQMARRIEELSEAARARKATPEQLSGGTFTITNYGSHGGWMGTPIIRPPEVAIVGFGRIRDAVVPVDGAPAVRKMLPLAVSTDHRLNDGEHVGEFIATLAAYLSEPARLLGQL